MKPFIAFFILILLSAVEADLDEIKEKAQEYGAYDEVVANITEISYRGNIYYWLILNAFFNTLDLSCSMRTGIQSEMKT